MNPSSLAPLDYAIPGPLPRPGNSGGRLFRVRLPSFFPRSSVRQDPDDARHEVSEADPYVVSCVSSVRVALHALNKSMGDARDVGSLAQGFGRV